MENIKIFKFYNQGWDTTIKVLSDYFIDEMRIHEVDESGRVIGNWFRDYNKIGLGIYPEWIEFPIVFRVVRGNKFRDIIDTESFNTNMLISDRLKDLLEQEKVSGWQSYPIKLYDKKGSVVTGYHGFSVIGRGGEFEDKDEIPIMERVIKNIKWKYRISNWDGSDFFYINPGFFYVTDRVKKLFRLYGIQSAIRFEPWDVDIELIR